MRIFVNPTLAEKIISGTALIVCTYFAVSFLFLVLGNFWPGPLFDYWIDIPLLEKYFNHQLTFYDLVTAHNNAHRILIPRLLFILDYRFFAGTNILLVSVSILCKIFTILLFNILLKGKSLLTKLLLNALIFAAVLNAGNVYNILFNFDIQWDLVSVFSCYSIFFYTQIFQRKKSLPYRLLAYLFLCLGFFSHAGALSLPFVFIIISILNKKPKEALFNIILTFAIFYVNSLLPFADPDNPDVQSAFTTLILHTGAVATFVAKFVSGSLAFYLGSPGFYFSIYILLLLIVSVIFTVREPDASSKRNHVFLYFSLFLFLMIVSIAASRAIFTPRIWAASRFQTTALLFMLCAHIHAWLIIANFSKKSIRIFGQCFIAAHGFTVFFLIQYFTYNIPFKLSNAVFFSQAHMLAHERNQDSGARLLLWLHETDVIADSDPFFRKNGFAWYANKLHIEKRGGAELYKDFTDTGKILITPDQIPTFQNTCIEKITPLKYLWTPEDGIEFTSPLKHSNVFMSAVLHRKTYYALDKNGVVLGAAYIFVSEDGFYKQASLSGYSLTQTVQFFSEIDYNGQARCLYTVAPDKE